MYKRGIILIILVLEVFSARARVVQSPFEVLISFLPVLPIRNEESSRPPKMQVPKVLAIAMRSATNVPTLRIPDIGNNVTIQDKKTDR
mmetsp:Transcript_26544/g.55916  ORF Transcript_26544/g.55916 Transcript_26544/m.55916 type:complete len:88 (+) Transcript_26544:697-960(+)